MSIDVYIAFEVVRKPTYDEWIFPSLLFGAVHFIFRDIRSNFSFLCHLYGLIYILDQSPTSYHDFNQAGVIRMIELFCMESASWTGLFSHIGYACQTILSNQ